MYLHCSCAPMAHADVETIAEMYEGLQLAQRKLILMPINNNSDPTKAGGSHWYGSHAETRSNMLLVCGVDGGACLLCRSLLVFTRSDAAFRHYDSYGQANLPNAKRVTRVLSQVICGSTSRS
jgi:hypothetical protein